ncbi:Segregation and condensation protein B [Symmachiella macrocystis]|uniref:Segregation and condensation protein B n=1 Tax=Symmachiella macrocystis TaxID=2527985 RepID=A0A5C6BIT5_9PLAN|nr:SMC-Scp complex subunit ScpB [Symmachiella macrocystis]TWU11955.1 Segregation and condensation protein B [Symmachiella macrocystis]
MRNSNPTFLKPGRLQATAAGGFGWNFRIRREAESLEPLTPGHFLRDDKMARLEAALFVSQDALPARRLAHVATLADATEVRTLIKRINEFYDASETAFRVERVAAGYQLLTRPEFALWLGKLHHRQAELKLSPSAMETLAIVAYRQPVTRANIEAVRGVQSTEMLKQLMERNLVRIAGNEETLGRPFLYGTTRLFLELFGLQNLESLPMADRLRVTKPAAADVSEEPEAEPEIAGSIQPVDSDDSSESDVQRIA